METEISKILRRYKAWGVKCFPLRKFKLGDAESKRPLESGWPTADYDESTLEAHHQQGHGIGGVLPDTIVVVDVDAPTPERPTKRGLSSRAKLEDLLGVDLEKGTVVVKSPSGGRHLYFTKPADVEIVKKLPTFPDIEFLTHGCYVVVPPSPHWQGGEYEFVGDCHEIAIIPPQLLKLITRERVEGGVGGHAAIDESQLAALLDCLDPCEFREHDDWFKVFAASHSASGGSAEGLAVFTAWSTADPAYSAASGDIAHRWKTLHADKSKGSTVKTLFNEVRKLNDPSKTAIAKRIGAAIDFGAVDATDGQPKLVEVEHGYDDFATAERVIEALQNDDGLYQRHGVLVDVHRLKGSDLMAAQTGATEGTPTIRPLGHELIGARISRRVNLGNEVTNKDGDILWKRKRIPPQLAKIVWKWGDWPGTPVLKGVIESPTFLPSGEVLQVDGFHSESGLLYEPATGFKTVADEPTKKEALAAMARLENIVCDFPFKADPHKSAFLSLLFAMFSRHAVTGPTPLWFIDGNHAGVGKTLLADVAALIATGRNMPRTDYPTGDKMQELLRAAATSGYPSQMFDNVPNGTDFGHASLDAILTSDTWTYRPLYSNDLVTAQWRTVLVASGNGLSLSPTSDTIRRISYIKLDCKDERPDARSKFKHGSEAEFRVWIVRNRGQFAADVLTILRAYHVAGRPIKSIPAWGSYSGFSNLVRQCFVWLDRPDPYASRADLSAADGASEDLTDVVHGLQLLLGQRTISADQIRDELHNIDFGKGTKQVERDALLRVRALICPKSDATARSVGRKLGGYKEKTVNGWRLEKRTGSRSGWAVEEIGATSA